MKIKVTDLIADFFKKKNINQVFGVTGGAAVHFLILSKNINIR